MCINETSNIQNHHHVKSSYTFHSYHNHIRTTSQDFPHGQLVPCISRVHTPTYTKQNTLSHPSQCSLYYFYFTFKNNCLNRQYTMRAKHGIWCHETLHRKNVAYQYSQFQIMNIAFQVDPLASIPMEETQFNNQETCLRPSLFLWHFNLYLMSTIVNMPSPLAKGHSSLLVHSVLS